jgi:hypothetical protein
MPANPPPEHASLDTPLQALIQHHHAKLSAAADELFDLLEQFQRQGEHPVMSVIRDGEQPFTQFTHYPAGDVDDTHTGYAWYYHAHAPSDNRPWQEHGHFHCYAYTEIVPTDATPIALPQQPDPIAGGLVHLIALCVNEAGVPCRLFTLNRWASGEWLYPAQVVAELAARFQLENPRHQLTSRWLSIMLRVLQPQIEWLLRQRDAQIFPHYPDLAVNRSEDVALEITSTLAFDLDEYLEGLEPD